MTRPRTGRREPAPTDVDRVTASASIIGSTPATVIKDVSNVEIFEGEPCHS